MEIPKKHVQEIISKYKNKDLPCLSDTLMKLSSIDSDSGSAFEELCNIILEDMGLTGKVIKTVNSVYYRRCGQEITTVTQALVLLGFETVRKIALNMAVLDLAERNQNAALASLILGSFTAAFLSQDILDQRQEGTGESIFISSLFHSLGRIILCLHNKEMYEQFSEMEFVDKRGKKESASLFGELGRAFGDLWGLPRSIVSFMEEAQENPNILSRMIGRCHLAVRAAFSDNGSRALPEVLEQIAQETSSSPEKVSEKMSKAFHSSLKLSPALKGIVSPTKLKKICNKLESAEIKQLEEPRTHREPGKSKKQQQFVTLLAQLTSTLANKNFKLQDVYLFAAEALLRGVCVERVILCLLTVDRKWLVPRYAIGKEAKSLKETLKLPFPATDKSVKDAFLKNQVQTFFWKNILKGTFKDTGFSNGRACLAPIVVQDRPVGCFLLDRPVSHVDFLPEDLLKTATIRDLVVLATLSH